jgi:hypothetical protein
MRPPAPVNPPPPPNSAVPAFHLLVAVLAPVALAGATLVALRESR